MLYCTYFRAVTLLCNIREGDPYVRHMFCNADFLTFAAWGNLIYSSLCFPPTNAAKGNSGLGSHIFWLWLPFYSDEKQTCRMRNEDKERERGEKKKVQGVSGQSSGLVIRVTLGIVPPLTWGVALPAGPHPCQIHAYSQYWVLLLPLWQWRLSQWHTV